VSLLFAVCLARSERSCVTGETMSNEEIARAFDLLLGPLDPLGHLGKQGG
jgi:hypothetical protein